MPKGVEHTGNDNIWFAIPDVGVYKMPKGVEHCNYQYKENKDKPGWYI